MNASTIVRLLENSGFHNIQVNADGVSMEDPSCILRSFETFTEYAWTAIAILTGLMLFGWAISMIRGAKNDLFMNLRNLILIFGILSLAKPIMNVIYGGDLFAHGCKTIEIPMDEINKLLEARNSKLTDRSQYDLYEEFNIYDSGPTKSNATDDKQSTPSR